MRFPRRAPQSLALSCVLALALSGCSGGAPQPDPAPSPAPGSSSPAPSGSASAPASPTASQGPTASPTPTASPQDPEAQRANELVRDLEVQQQAGLLVMAGVPATGATQQELDQLADAGIASVFLRGRSQLSLQQTAGQVKQIRKAVAPNVPGQLEPWIATDQEGGSVRVLQGSGFTNLPSAQTQGGWSAKRLAQSTGQLGRQLSEAGVNVNLAPVADTVPKSLGAGNAPIGQWQRNFGYDPDTVWDAVGEVNQALDDAGVQPVIKHFPGLGRVKGNTDTTERVVDTVTDAQDPYLQPFVRGIEQDLAWVMISNASYSKLDAKNPAPFSRAIIDELLRDQLGYEGLVISDDLCDAAAVSETALGQRAVKFIAAGGTLALCVQADEAVQMVQAIAARAAKDGAFADTVRQAATLVVTEHLRAQE